MLILRYWYKNQTGAVSGEISSNVLGASHLCDIILGSSFPKTSLCWSTGGWRRAKWWSLSCPSRGSTPGRWTGSTSTRETRERGKNWRLKPSQVQVQGKRWENNCGSNSPGYVGQILMILVLMETRGLKGLSVFLQCGVYMISLHKITLVCLSFLFKIS